MKTVNLKVCLIIVLVFSCLGGRTLADVTYFADHFDGDSVDTDKWIASLGPPRMDPDDNWVIPSGDPDYGTITVANSWISLNGSSTVFPYVTSKNSIFPETGDFELEFKMRYDTLNPHGNGFCVVTGEKTEPWLTIFSVWHDSGLTTHLTVGLDIFGTNWHGELLDTSEHVYRFEYTNGEYTAFIDETQILGPIANSLRPDWLWFGNPGWTSWGTAPWTTLSVDYVIVNTPNVIPAPSAILLGGIGLSFVGYLRRRRTL